MRLGDGRPQNSIEIVGVVADAKHASVKDDVPALVYYPRLPERRMAPVAVGLRARQTSMPMR